MKKVEKLSQYVHQGFTWIYAKIDISSDAMYLTAISAPSIFPSHSPHHSIPDPSLDLPLSCTSPFTDTTKGVKRVFTMMVEARVDDDDDDDENHDDNYDEDHDYDDVSSRYRTPMPKRLDRVS